MVSEGNFNKKLETNMNNTNMSTFVTDGAPTERELTMSTTNRTFTSEKVNINSFTIIKHIGRGSYARVFLVKKNDSGQFYAMKVLKKNKISNGRSKSRVKIERDIIMSIRHPFIVDLHYSFQTEEKLYFILDYLNGGDIYTHIMKHGKFKEKRAKFYAAEIVCALNHLHENNIVYRDLKPQNIIIDRNGHVKLTDFGLSKPDFDQSQENTI